MTHQLANVATVIAASKHMGVIDLSQMRKMTPAVFATKPSKKVSEDYQFISTSDIITAFGKAGLVPVEARQYQRKNAVAVPHSRHMLKFRPAGNIKTLTKVGDVVPQVIVVNSHDRSASFRMFAGLYRLVCSNGMVTATDFSASVNVRHFGASVEQRVEQALKVVGSFGKEVAPLIDMMMKAKLNERQQLAFARLALEVKAGYQNPRAMVIDAETLLAPRRTEDKGNDVWSIFNRVQENIIKGGIEAHDEDNRVRLTRPILSLTTDLNVNQGLWQAAVATAQRAISSAKKSSRSVATA